MSSNVVVIKVKRSNVGGKIPFDKIYLFRKEDEHLISDIFGYAIVFPLTKQLLDSITDLEPTTVSQFKQHRDDALLNTALQAPRKTLELEDWWNATFVDKYDFKNRLIVIPVLTSNLKGKLHPKYLASKAWYSRRASGRRRRYLPIATNPRGPAISDMAYLATPLEAPNDKISPVCTVCPRQLLQLQGDCEPGQPICLESLDFNTIAPVASNDPGYSDGDNPFSPADYTDNVEEGY